MPRLVVQRGADGSGRLYVAGQLSAIADRIEAQLTPVAAGQGTATAWQTVQTNPAKGLFLGQLTGVGGWYVLTVRAVRSGLTIGQATVGPVGIGEVFIAAGQSNSRGLGIGDNDLGSVTGRVTTIDTINHYYPPGAQALYSSGDPSPVPHFVSLVAKKRVFPMGESSWGWGELGDYLVNRLNVPVVFYNAGWDSSTIENWINTANGIPACNRYFCAANWPNLQPYTNLKNVLRYYGATGGARAVLWHQGESEYGDASSGTIPQYATQLRELIQKSRADFGGRNLPWVVARVSFDGQTTRQAVIDKQLEVIQTPGLTVFQGPLNDTIQNRHGGAVDVHFQNSQRPVVHPQYYLNPNTIPDDMGLSRFARNWNASLDNAFFQNATPILPEQFIATDNPTGAAQPGQTIRVSFAQSGTFAAGNTWQLQLLDTAGRYKAILATGGGSPVTAVWPDSLASGQFRVRVVATNPVVAGVPSGVFRVGPAADLSLSMAISRRAIGINDTTTITLKLTNSGPGPATGITVQNRLPGNLSVVATNGLVLQNGLLTGQVAQLNSGASALFSMQVRPTVGGMFQNAAQLTTSDFYDPDSQTNSGTGDGQDDTAIIDFRTTDGSTTVYTSPNPDQTPLPAVQSNQPAPDPAKADLSLQVSVNNRTPAVGEIITYAVVISNRGGASASAVSVTAALPASVTLVPGDDFVPGSGGVVGTTASVPAGGQAIFHFRVQALASGRAVITAEITQATPADPDSTPNNGITNGEDDTATTDIRVK